MPLVDSLLVEEVHDANVATAGTKIRPRQLSAVRSRTGNTPGVGARPEPSLLLRIPRGRRLGSGYGRAQGMIGSAQHRKPMATEPRWRT